MYKQLIFMVGLAAGCGAAQSQAQAVSTEAWHAVPDANGVQVVNVECGNGIFDPHEIVVKGNRPVELRVRTSEPSLEFVSDLTPGQGKAIGKQGTPHRFTPTAHGDFVMSCDKQGAPKDPGGKGKKKGKLTVVPDNGVSR